MNARAARFCTACGRELDPGRAAAEHARELRSARSLVGAIALLFLGSLAVVILSALLGGDSAAQRGFIAAPLLALVGLAAARVLGPGALRATLAGRPSVWGMAAGLGAGVLGFAASLAYVSAMRRWAGAAEVPLEGDAGAVLAVVVLAPWVEEWLCRGVTWVALRRALSDGWTILVSAALFAFLHGLGAAGLLEYPHRFALGLLLGLLRARSGSLAPGILAHALSNGLALIWIES